MEREDVVRRGERRARRRHEFFYRRHSLRRPHKLLEFLLEPERLKRLDAHVVRAFITGRMRDACRASFVDLTTPWRRRTAIPGGGGGWHRAFAVRGAASDEAEKELVEEASVGEQQGEDRQSCFSVLLHYLGV